MVLDRVFSAVEQSRSSHLPMTRGTQEMVASGHQLATFVEMRIIEKGGNAIDSGIAAGICLSVLRLRNLHFC